MKFGFLIHVGFPDLRAWQKSNFKNPRWRTATILKL